jgi:hypothetical protein
MRPQADPITFYRGSIATKPGVLVSNFNGYEWHRGLNRAQCATGHRAPDPKCPCGFYGYLDIRDAVDHWFADQLDAGMPEDDVMNVPIVFEAAGYGLAEVGSVGCRVEYATIEGLLDIGQGIDLTSWATAYDVIVVQSGVDISPVAEGTVEGIRLTDAAIEVTLIDGMKKLRTFIAPRYSRVGINLRVSVHAADRLRIVKNHGGEILDFKNLVTR